MNINPIVLSIPIFFLLIGLELLIQKFTHRKIYRLDDAITNISCGITQQVSGVFLKVLGIGAYMLVYENFAFFHIPTTWYTLIILFVLVDFFYYWAHRMSHEINLFWSGHVVHHQSEDYNLSVALRQSSFQVVWTFAFYLPLALIGFNAVDFALMAALTTLYQFWIHTEVIGKMGWLEYIIVTPSHHRVHHGRDPKYIDKNHGGAFIWWDMMFGTFQKEEETPVYGITKPINSWNPLWANFEHLALMWNEMKLIPNFTDKIKYVFYKPGWLPEAAGGYRPAPAINKAQYHKYESAPPSVVSYYVLFQYLLLLAITSWFLFNLNEFNVLEQLAIAFYIGFTTVTAGGLFEQKSWINLAEKLRILLTFATTVYLSAQASWALVPIFVGGAYTLVSWVWLNSALKTTTYDNS